MKVVYVGTSDWLAETLAERMGQEGNDVYILSDKEFPKKASGISFHRFYRSPRNGESFGKLLHSISPDCVIFAGKHYISGIHGEESDADVTLLACTLRAVATLQNVKFILLSSTEVYGNTEGTVDEDAKLAPVGERGVRFLREEQLLGIYRVQHSMDAVVLRASHLYSNSAKEDDGDFLSRIFSAAVQKKEHMTDDVFQPLHVSDLVDAVKRVMDARSHFVYNVCGSKQISAKRLYQLVCRQENISETDVQWEKSASVIQGDSKLIRQELGWSDFRNLENQMLAGEITYNRAPDDDKNKKKGIIPKPVRQIVENILLFAVFFALSRLCGSHPLFSRIDWMLIYVILVSVSYSIYQSAFAAFLASGAFLYSQNLNVMELGSFYYYAGSVLAVAEYVFLSLVVSYTANTLRENNRSIRSDLDMLKDEYKDLKAVNDENVLIKNEYEERLLTSKTGFPKLYSIVRRLMVQEPDRILMETMPVISELVKTDTVAVYKGQAGSPWLRLVGTLSDKSAMDGKTWNLSNSPKIYDAVMHGNLYQGEFGSGEPAVVLPIICRDAPQAVLLIKSLPYESESLYHINLLKTMALLLRDAMEKALQYEELSRDEQYVKGTDILKPEAFHKRILLAREEAEKHIAEYCVIELSYTGSLADAAQAAGRILRLTDCLGTSEDGKLFALLNNTGPESLERLYERLHTCGMDAHLVHDEQETH